MQVECDKQVRFLVAPNLREYAALDKEAVLIGVSSRVEIWSKSEWDTYNEEIGPVAAEIAEQLTDLGI